LGTARPASKVGQSFIFKSTYFILLIMPKKEGEAIGNGAPQIEDDEDQGEMTDSTTNSERTVVPGPHETGARRKSPIPSAGVSHPGEVATYLPSAAPFRYASHSAAKGAHTLLRKKIYSLVAQDADYR